LASALLSLGVLDTLVLPTSVIHCTAINYSPEYSDPFPQPQYDEAVRVYTVIKWKQRFPYTWNNRMQECQVVRRFRPRMSFSDDSAIIPFIAWLWTYSFRKFGNP